MEKTSYLLELKGISKYFPGVIANDHIDLRIKGGRVHAIIGENGAGKSTLMNIIAGSYFPDTGEIFLNGEKIELHSPGDAVKHGIGMVFQEFMLFPGLSILENIIMGAEPQKGCFIDQKKARESILCHFKALIVLAETLYFLFFNVSRQHTEVSSAVDSSLYPYAGSARSDIDGDVFLRERSIYLVPGLILLGKGRS